MMRLFATIVFGIFLTVPALAVLRLSQPFGEHMVLPRDVPVTLWGTGAPGGESVRVAIQGQTAVGSVDWNGRWMVQLKPLHAGGPFQMNVAIGGQGSIVPSSAANETMGLELNDVLVGDLIRFSPSSQAGLGVSKGTIASAAPPTHRYAFVRVYSSADLGWRLVRQDSIPTGLDSLFAAGHVRYEATHIPVGVLSVTSVPTCPPSTACSAH